MTEPQQFKVILLTSTGRQVPSARSHRPVAVLSVDAQRPSPGPSYRTNFRGPCDLSPAEAAPSPRSRLPCALRTLHGAAPSPEPRVGVCAGRAPSGCAGISLGCVKTLTPWERELPAHLEEQTCKRDTPLLPVVPEIKNRINTRNLQNIDSMANPSKHASAKGWDLVPDSGSCSPNTTAHAPSPAPKKRPSRTPGARSEDSHRT